MTDQPRLPDGVRRVTPDMPHRFAFSICTLMTRPDQYAAMVASYRAAGFGDDCEYLCLDNSTGNTFDAFSGYNAVLVEAQGEHVILTHQDVELAFDRRPELEARLRHLSSIDPGWGACGNAGGVTRGRLAMRITDPHGEDQSEGDFPQMVDALDENFIVLRRRANLCLSSDLAGYHMYGPDLAVLANIKGHRCYVIDFHLRHLSGGTIDDSFRDAADAFQRKYARAFAPRWIQTTVTLVLLSGSRPSAADFVSRLARHLKGWLRPV